METSRVVAVVVAYRPQGGGLQRLVAVLLGQVAHVVLVHNGPAGTQPLVSVERDHERLTELHLGENLGVARAQNVGIDQAREHRATHVVLFDQDSEPARDMIPRLLAAAYSMTQAGHRVAAVGPRYRDERQDNPPPFIQVRGVRLHRHRCDDEAAIVPVDYLVSSGCLMPMEALDAVGGMTEELFIDYVDIEWGLRAGAAGLQCFGVCGAHMRHSLGERPLMVMGRPRPLHTPLRHYYLFRNAVWLYRRPAVPRNWKWADGARLLLKYFAYSLYARPRAVHWWMMTLGVWHGLRGRLGRYGA